MKSIFLQGINAGKSSALSRSLGCNWKALEETKENCRGPNLYSFCYVVIHHLIFGGFSLMERLDSHMSSNDPIF